MSRWRRVRGGNGKQPELENSETRMKDSIHLSSKHSRRLSEDVKWEIVLSHIFEKVFLLLSEQ